MQTDLDRQEAAIELAMCGQSVLNQAQPESAVRRLMLPEGTQPVLELTDFHGDLYVFKYRNNHHEDRLTIRRSGYAYEAVVYRGTEEKPADPGQIREVTDLLLHVSDHSLVQ